MFRFRLAAYLSACLLCSQLMPLAVPPSVARAQSARASDDNRDSDERRGGWRRWRDRSSRRDEDRSDRRRREPNDDDRPENTSRDRSADDQTPDETDRRRSESSRRESPTSEAPASAPVNDASPDLKSWATSLVKENDKNGNMMLEGEELSSLRGKPAEADMNGDGVITVDELVTRLSTNAPAPEPASTPASSAGADRAPSPSSAPRTRRRSSERNASGGAQAEPGDSKRVYYGTFTSGDGNAAKPEKRSWRFTPPGERLPDGLPSWFTARDANGDGQVAMSEYSRSWSSRMVAEFERYDRNNDGIITAAEVAR